MEFWGVEVKAGKPLKVQLDGEKIIHLSQAALGESKKGEESVPLFVKFDGKKLILGHLSSDKFPHIPFDLVFEKDFELSHNWTGGSVFFTGYKTSVEEDDDFSDMPSDSEEELQMGLEENAVPKKLEDAAKPKSSVNPKAAEAVKDEGEDEDDDDDDTDSDEEMESLSDSDDDDDEEESDSEEDEEETPKKVAISKKRANGSASKTPDAKKAKLATPQTDGKKNGVHTATPHPAKKGTKTPADSKKQQQSPKSAGSVSCDSCSKTFNSATALQSHSKAKHGAK